MDVCASILSSALTAIRVIFRRCLLNSKIIGAFRKSRNNVSMEEKKNMGMIETELQQDEKMLIFQN